MFSDLSLLFSRISDVMNASVLIIQVTSVKKMLYSFWRVDAQIIIEKCFSSVIERTVKFLIVLHVQGPRTLITLATSPITCRLKCSCKQNIWNAYNYINIFYIYFLSFVLRYCLIILILYSTLVRFIINISFRY